MAWVKLDDAMPHHPKVMAAGPQAFALDVAGICYSNKHATDGFIAEASLPAVLPAMSNPKRWANKLVEVGRWVEVDGGWQIHDISDYQPTAQEQKEVSKKRARAGRKGGTKSGEVRRSKAEPKPKQVASTEANPDPTRPVEEPKHSDQTDRTVVHANGGLPAEVVSKILDQSDAFRMIRKRRRWPEYERVLLEWSDLDARGMATAADVFASLAAEGYADTPNLLRAACEKVALHGPARELVEAQTREAQAANEWMADE